MNMRLKTEKLKNKKLLHLQAGEWKPYTIEELSILVLKLRKHIRDNDKRYFNDVFIRR